MKRFTALAAFVCVVAVASVAVAAGGPGKFQTKLAGKGAKTEHGQLDGTWTITLSSTSGKLRLTWNGRKAGGGTYAISGSTIRFKPKKGGQCKTNAKYRFKLASNKLTFTALTDTCTVRRDVLTGHLWTRVA